MNARRQVTEAQVLGRRELTCHISSQSGGTTMAGDANIPHHVGLIARDLDPAIGPYERLGFSFTPLPRIPLRPRSSQAGLVASCCNGRATRRRTICSWTGRGLNRIPREIVMKNMTEKRSNQELVAAVCRELYLLASREERAAADEACRVPYWQACPPSVNVHWTAAQLLRADANRLESEAGLLAEAC
ncbi:hypothetical protein ACFPJ1_08905 [Kribbella qitaiheensis]|uniref:hypothetical protein n=1 Tax=Kribbella qitaiheensis TaxID=1544730 RepID=UPI00360DB890